MDGPTHLVGPFQTSRGRLLTHAGSTEFASLVDAVVTVHEELNMRLTAARVPWRKAKRQASCRVAYIRVENEARTENLDLERRHFFPIVTNFVGVDIELVLFDPTVDSVALGAARCKLAIIAIPSEGDRRGRLNRVREVVADRGLRYLILIHHRVPSAAPIALADDDGTPLDDCYNVYYEGTRVLQHNWHTREAIGAVAGLIAMQVRRPRNCLCNTPDSLPSESS